MSSMVSNTNTIQNIKIYRDGQLDRWATYSPVIKAQLDKLWYGVNYWFEHQGAWPTNSDLLQ